MAYFRLALNAGIDKQNTEYGAEGGWTDGDNVRFRFGLVCFGFVVYGER